MRVDSRLIYDYAVVAAEEFFQVILIPHTCTHVLLVSIYKNRWVYVLIRQVIKTEIMREIIRHIISMEIF